MKYKGFTLIELMIVVAIIGVLAAIAYPSYQEYIARARRADAKTVLLENAQFLERFYTQHGTYLTVTLPDGTSLTAVLPISEAPKDGGAKFYDISFVVQTATAFQIQAVPKNAQSGDKCGTMLVNQSNVKDVSGATLDKATCWNK